MKERYVGTITEYPYIDRLEDNKTLIVRGFNTRETQIRLFVELDSNMARRLDQLACSIGTLKRMFKEVKAELEEELEATENWARDW